MDGGSGWGRDGCGSGTGLDPDSIGSVDPDPEKSEGVAAGLSLTN